MYRTIHKELKKYTNLQKATFLTSYFKTKQVQTREDLFLGVSVPQCRKIALLYKALPLPDIQQIISSPFHEERLLALFILVSQFTKGDVHRREMIYWFYLDNRRYVDNWDLVDSSADKIVGAYLYNKSTEMLSKLAVSSHIWDRRIAIIATFHWIKQGNATVTLQIAHMLLHDPEDLIQKAVGWMLREVGKRCSLEEEEQFLLSYYHTIPRTMLRYAIERFPEEKRLAYLRGTI